jgi:hypothetical protein
MGLDTHCAAISDPRLCCQPDLARFCCNLGLGYSLPYRVTLPLSVCPSTPIPIKWRAREDPLTFHPPALGAALLEVKDFATYDNEIYVLSYERKLAGPFTYLRSGPRGGVR